MLDATIGTRFTVGDYQRHKAPFVQDLEEYRRKLVAARTQAERDIANAEINAVLKLWTRVLGKLGQPK